MGRSLGRSALLAGGRIKGKEEEEERVEEGKEEESGRKGRGAPTAREEKCVSRGGVQTRGRISRYLEDKGCFRRSSKIAKGTLKRCSLLLTLCLCVYVYIYLSLAISAATSRLPSAHPLLSPPTRIDSYVRDVFSRRWIVEPEGSLRWMGGRRSG